MKNPGKMNKLIGLFIFIMSFPLIFASCRFEVPIKEMANAKTTITGAIEVKSEKYAPEELKQAKKHMLKCHEFIKSEDADKAKDEANSAKKMADDAITKSLPPLAADTLNEAKTLRDEAVYVYSEKYSPEELSLANDNISAAESLNTESKFWDSYLKSKDGVMYAGEAKNKSLANIPALRDMISRINSETDSLEAERGKEFASEEISRIRALTVESVTLLDEKKIKDAFPEIEQADELLKTAKLKVLKGIAADQIIVAEELLKKSGDSNYKDSYTTELKKAGGLITISKDSFNKEAFDESRIKSQEAIDILNSVFIAMEKNAEESRIVKEEKWAIAEMKEYVVKLSPGKRDCLWRIAEYMYNNAKLWPVIYMANRDKIKDPDLIFPGQKFIIPPIPQKETGQSPDVKKEAEIEKDDSGTNEAGREEVIRTADESVSPAADDSASVKDEQPQDKSVTDVTLQENIDNNTEGGAGSDINKIPDSSGKNPESEIDSSDTLSPPDVEVYRRK